MITDKEINQVADDEKQKDWNELRYADIYKDAFVDGAKWARSKVSRVELPVKPACGKCIDCKFYIDMDYQKDIQNACSNSNVMFGYIPMEADKFGCIYFESKSV